METLAFQPGLLPDLSLKKNFILLIHSERQRLVI